MTVLLLFLLNIPRFLVYTVQPASCKAGSPSCPTAGRIHASDLTSCRGFLLADRGAPDKCFCISLVKPLNSGTLQGLELREGEDCVDHVLDADSNFAVFTCTIVHVHKSTLHGLQI